MMLKENARLWAVAGLLGTLGCGGAQTLYAQTQPTAPPAPVAEMSTTDLLNLLVSEGVISKEAAVRLLTTLRARAERAQARGAAGTNANVAAGTNADVAAGANADIIVPHIPPHVEARIVEAIKKDLAVQAVADAQRAGLAPPEWVTRVRLSGDVRVRYSEERYPGDNPIYGVYNTNAINDAGGTSAAGRSAYININDDRERMLGRARLKVTAKPANDVEVGIRLTSGNEGSPVSANQTLGQYGAKWDTNFDLAYIQYDSRRLLLSAGRMENPWLSTDLVWDKDMTFEGLFGQVSPYRIDGEERVWNTYINLGAFPLQEIHQFEFPGEPLDAPDDKWIYSAGLGSELRFNPNHQLDLALTYHDFKNVTGIKNPPGQNSQDPSAPPFFQWGNVLQNIAVPLPGDDQEELYALAGEFEILNFTARYDYRGFSAHRMTVIADYVQNLAWDAAAVSAAAGSPATIPDRDTGYQLEMAYGTDSRSQRGDWGVSVTYRYLEGDAVIDAFADSDFLMGGTNAQGYIIKAQHFLVQNVWLELTLMSADEIDYPIGIEERDVRKDTVFLDLHARF